MPTIERRGDRWTVRVTLPADPLTGRRAQRRLTGPTKRDVQDQLTKLTHEVRSGTYLEASTERLDSFLSRWLTTLDIRPSTRIRYDSDIRLHLSPAIGHLRLADVTAPIIAHRLAELRGAGMDSSSLVNVYSVLRHSLAQAVAWGLLARNPIDGVARPHVQRKKQPVWTLADARRFLDLTADDPLCGVLWRLIAETGLRRSEALALDWSDINVETGSLQVSKSLTKTTAGWVLGEPKSDAGARSVILSAPLIEALAWHRAAQDARQTASAMFWQDGEVVFDSGDGSRWMPTTITARFSRLVKQHQMPHGTIHALRRLAGRLMVVGNVPIKVAQQRLGHANARITLDLYSSVETEIERNAAAVLGDLLSVQPLPNGKDDSDQPRPVPISQRRKTASS